ncbi:MAG: winged helix-turn-helix domain-containing protein [Candidatus Nanoarchaeia archaeon]|jgi:predicted transcriptional regulator|nr:winged helix-turn-helix domain-containing protein [Candidatus Nanoarchaeia archaeon]
MNKRRSRVQIIFDILNSIKIKGGTIKPTHLLYKSNLSHNMMNEYLIELIGKEFVTEHLAKTGKMYSLTRKGYEYLSEYDKVQRFMDSFGLDEL